jgi:hypothetical protein
MSVKGDWSRVKDVKGYRDNYDNIFRKIKKNLFLDDVRDPKDAFCHFSENFNRKSLSQVSGISDSEWSVVRSYEDFVSWVETNGIPDTVSFDIDLHEEHYYSDSKNLESRMRDEKNIGGGFRCADYLLNKCKRERKDFPEYYIHSMNESCIEIFRKFLEENI